MFLKFPAQLSPIPLCQLPTSTWVHITGTRTPFLLLQHLLPLSFIFCSKLPAATFSGLWGQLPNPASPLPRYAGLDPLTTCSAGPVKSGVGDTWGQLRVLVLPGHLRQATYLHLFLHWPLPGRSVKIKLEFFFCLNTIEFPISLTHIGMCYYSYSNYSTKLPRLRVLATPFAYFSKLRANWCLRTVACLTHILLICPLHSFLRSLSSCIHQPPAAKVQSSLPPQGSWVQPLPWESS